MIDIFVSVKKLEIKKNKLIKQKKFAFNFELLIGHFHSCDFVGKIFLFVI